MTTPLHAAMYVLSEQLKAHGRYDLAAACEAAVSDVPDHPVDYKLAARDLFVAAVENARARGDVRAAAALEQIIAELKDGKDRRIVGALNYAAGATPSQINDTAERMARNAIRQLGG